ncbi:MAG TPA: hypothetical protein VEB20_21915 [Azospirillaceae bacterium]|nr:hypothetical protein [Azospirillaceae bacterium]
MTRRLALILLSLPLAACAAAPEVPPPVALSPPPLDGPAYIRAAAAGLRAYVEEAGGSLDRGACLGFMPRGRVLGETRDLATFSPDMAGWISGGRGNWSPLLTCGHASDGGGAFRAIPGDRPLLLYCEGIDATPDGWRMHCGTRRTATAPDVREYRVVPEGQGYRVARTCAACRI